MSESTVLVTGVTGTLGKYLLSALNKRNVRIIALVRAKSADEALERIKKNCPDATDIRAFATDLNDERLGLPEEDFIHISKNTTHILHAAASTRFNLPIEEARRNNVETTRHMLEFSKGCTNLVRFGFMSTALVAGKRSGIILESDFEHADGFLNTYQQSKYEAESLVREAVNKLPVLILRPPLIMSPYRGGGKPTNLLTMSFFLVRKGVLPIVPGSEHATLDIIDGDVVAQLSVDLLLKEELHHLTYHLTNGANAITAGEIVSYAEEHLREKLPVTFCGTMDSFQRELKRRSRFNPAMQIVYKKIMNFLPELAYPKVYDNRNTLHELGIERVPHNIHAELKSILL